METSEKSHVTSGKRYSLGLPISYINCSATVPNDIRPPVLGGLDIIKLPSEEHSTMGKPMLCLKG